VRGDAREEVLKKDPGQKEGRMKRGVEAWRKDRKESLKKGGRKKRPLRILAGLLILLALAGRAGALSPSPALAGTGSFLGQSPLSLLEPHPGFKVEWWYVTGFLKTGSGEHLGFQGTFFRFRTGYTHPASLPASPWEPKEILSFHGAISFLDEKRFVSGEKTRRSFRSLAGSRARPFSVFVDSDRLESTGTTATGDPVFSLTERVGGHLLRLTMTPETGPLWQDPSGKLRTGPRSSDWAWYYSYPEMTVTGTLEGAHRNGHPTGTAVSGEAWFDHEWTSQALGRDQRGWIWMWGLFDSPRGKEGVMLFQMIRKDGSLDLYRGGTVFKITPKGLASTYERSREVHVDSLVFKKTGDGCVPEKVRFTLGNGESAGVTPFFPGQVLKGSTTYWEGSVRVDLGKDKARLAGKGYLEVTGVVSEKGDCPF
jgi:predicted secreted hydrolase